MTEEKQNVSMDLNLKRDRDRGTGGTHPDYR